MSKLVENLAEELADKLKENGTLDLSDNETFGEFTDLLYEILDHSTKTDEKADELGVKLNDTNEKITNIDKDITDLAVSVYDYFNKDEEKEGGEKTENKQDDIIDRLKNLRFHQARLQGSVNRLEELAQKSDKRIEEQGKNIEVLKKKLLDEFGHSSDTGGSSTSTTDGGGSGTAKSRYSPRLLHSIRRDIREVDARRHKDNIKMTRSIKSSIKNRFGKWWARLKKVLLIASIFLFGDFVKSILKGVAELTEPIWRPFVNWFQTNFPVLSSYIADIAHGIGWLLDAVNNLMKFNEENPTLGKVVNGALIGAAAGATTGIVGALIGAIAGAMGGLGVAWWNENKQAMELIDSESQKKIDALNAQKKGGSENAVHDTEIELQIAREKQEAESDKIKSERGSKFGWLVRASTLPLLPLAPVYDTYLSYKKMKSDLASEKEIRGLESDLNYYKGQERNEEFIGKAESGTPFSTPTQSMLTDADGANGGNSFITQEQNTFVTYNVQPTETLQK